MLEVGAGDEDTLEIDTGSVVLKSRPGALSGSRPGSVAEWLQSPMNPVVIIRTQCHPVNPAVTLWTQGSSYEPSGHPMNPVVILWTQWSSLSPQVVHVCETKFCDCNNGWTSATCRVRSVSSITRVLQLLYCTPEFYMLYFIISMQGYITWNG